MNIREIQKKYKFSFKSSLGQNFFNNNEMLDEILNSLDLNQNDVVLEIGSGFGILTERLLNVCKSVVSVEIDSSAVHILTEEFKGRENFTIINRDFLKVDLNELGFVTSIKVIANIPYYITTPILEKLFKSNIDIDFIAVMIQKEVGDRILAKSSTKEYGSLTIFSNYFSIPKLIKKIPAGNFLPPPKVDSVFLKFEIKKQREFQNSTLEKEFLDFVKKCFSMRRKNLYNVLSQFKKSKEELQMISEKLSLDFYKRAENLEIEAFKNIFIELNKSN